MARENAHEKGRRLLAEGRLRVVHVEGNTVMATCRGDSAQVYRCGHRTGAWYCDCPALSTCSHLVALRLCVIVGGAT